MLSVSQLSCITGKQSILKDIDLKGLPSGKLTAVLGPNGAGKSTLFRCLAGLQPSHSDYIDLNGLDLNALDTSSRLAKASYMPQHYATNARLTVFELVLLAYKNLSGWQTQSQDLETVEELLHEFGIAELSERYVGALSGGQQQMVSLCQALCRPASLYMLDEPTSALDLGRQLHVMTRLKHFAADQSVVMMLALHDLSLAVRFAEYAVVLSEGRVIDQGPMLEVLKGGILDELYGIKSELLQASDGGLVLASRLCEPF